MKTVYVLQSVTSPNRYYVGIATDPNTRLLEHNRGESTHTAKFRPWKIIVAVGFADDDKAHAFERYLKSGSGRAFASKHF